MERYNNGQIRITNVNQRELARRKRRRIQRRNRFIAALLGLGILFSVKGCTKTEEPPHIMPEDYVQIYVTDDVEYGDTLTGIAGTYYDDDVYDSYYGNIENYIDAIADTNNINKERINPYQSLTVPVFVGEENIYLTQIKQLEEEIEKLPRWVNYTIEYGDTILSLAYKGAGNTNEAYSIKDSIISRNGLKNSIIREGMEIQIVNPEIGKLKVEIERLKELLHESVKVNSQDETEKTY